MMCFLKIYYHSENARSRFPAMECSRSVYCDCDCGVGFDSYRFPSLQHDVCLAHPSARENESVVDLPRCTSEKRKHHHKTTNHQPSIINHQPPTTNHQPSNDNHNKTHPLLKDNQHHALYCQTESTAHFE
jgi:hypothetical protein